MTATPNEELIDAAQAVLKPHVVERRLFGDVASTLVTDRGTRYSGVCIDTSSGTGFCAEHSAIAAMVTAGEYRIAKIVAVWRHEDGALHVLAPCGRCREFSDQDCRAGSARVPAWLVERLRLGSGMPAPSGQIPPPWAWWENEAPATRTACGLSQA
jgi:cytidine deaminase